MHLLPARFVVTVGLFALFFMGASDVWGMISPKVPVLHMEGDARKLRKAMKLVAASAFLQHVFSRLPVEQLVKQVAGLAADCPFQIRSSLRLGANVFLSQLTQRAAAFAKLKAALAALEKHPTLTPEQKSRKRAALIKQASWLSGLAPKGQLFTIEVSGCPSGNIPFNMIRLLERLPTRSNPFKSLFRGAKKTQKTFPNGVSMRLLTKGDLQMLFAVIPDASRSRRWKFFAHVFRKQGLTLSKAKAPSLQKLAFHSTYQKAPFFGVSMFPDGLAAARVLLGYLRGERALASATVSIRKRLHFAMMSPLFQGVDVMRVLNATRATSRSLWLGIAQKRFRFQLFDIARTAAVAKERRETLAWQHAIFRQHQTRKCILSLAFSLPKNYFKLMPLEALLGERIIRRFRVDRQGGVLLFAAAELTPLTLIPRYRWIKSEYNKHMPTHLHLGPTDSLHSAGFCLASKTLSLTLPIPKMKAFRKWAKKVYKRYLQKSQIKKRPKLELLGLPIPAPLRDGQVARIFSFSVPDMSRILSYYWHGGWFQRGFLRAERRTMSFLLSVLPMMPFWIEGSATQKGRRTTYTIDFSTKPPKPSATSRPASQPASRPTSRSTKH